MTLSHWDGVIANATAFVRQGIAAIRLIPAGSQERPHGGA